MAAVEHEEWTSILFSPPILIGTQPSVLELEYSEYGQRGDGNTALALPQKLFISVGLRTPRLPGSRERFLWSTWVVVPFWVPTP